MNKFQYTKNVKSGDDGGDLYWRVLWTLQDDPLANMLDERVLMGVAEQMRRIYTNDKGVVPKYGCYGQQVGYNAKQVLHAAPLGWTGDRFKEHVAGLIVRSFFPEGENED